MKAALARLHAALQTWMLRGQRFETLPIRLASRRVYILPTREGLGFAALLLVMLIASLNYNLALGFLLCFSLVGIGQICLLRTHRNIEGLILSGARATNAHEGGSLAFELIFTDRSSRPREALELSGAQVPALRFSIAADDSRTVRLALPARRRGRQAVGRIRIETRFPLGLLRSWTLIEPAISAWVYPRPEAKAPPPPGSGRDGNCRPTSGQEDFDSLRPWQAGDALRTIAWKRLARGGSPASKRFTSPQGGELALDWRACQDLPGVEAKLSRLCAWALEAERLGLAWSLSLPGTHLATSRGPKHIDAALEALASFPSADEN